VGPISACFHTSSTSIGIAYCLVKWYFEGIEKVKTG
jgi:hypothetical protein